MGGDVLVCGGDCTPYLDTLVRACTALTSMGALLVAMDGGYVPTIYPVTRRKRILRNVLDGLGYRVWPAMK